MLVSVSLYEDAHENTGKGINACISHCAGHDPQDLSANSATDGRTIYDLQVIASEDWQEIFEKAKGKINEKGGQEGHMVSTTNDSSTDGGVAIVISWSSLMEGNLREAIRPAGCMDNCTIF